MTFDEVLAVSRELRLLRGEMQSTWGYEGGAVDGSGAWDALVEAERNIGAWVQMRWPNRWDEFDQGLRS